MGTLQTVKHALSDLRSAIFNLQSPAPAIPASPILPPGGYSNQTPDRKGGVNGQPVAGAPGSEPDLTSIGATGTPIISGFVTDLQEYNPQMRGRTALPIYEQMRRSDADVAATLAACKLPIRSARFQVMPGAKQNDPGYARAKEIAKFVEDNLFGGLETTDDIGQISTQRFESIIENALLCLDFGCAGHEDVWRIDGDRILLRRIAPRLPLTFYRFLVAADGETLEAVEQWGYRGQNWVRVQVPASKFTLFCLNREGANFYGRSILRQAYQHWYIKSQLYRIDAISCERNAMGIPVITAAENASQEDKATGVNWVQNLAAHENTGLFLPFGYQFTLRGMEGQTRDPLPSIQHHSEQITRSVLAMFLNLGSTQTGSRALGNSFLDFFHLSLNATAALICDTISETTIRRLVDFNFEETGARSQSPQSRGTPKSGQRVYPRLHVPHINTLNPLEMVSLLKDISHKDVDLVQPDDELENDLRATMGLPLKSSRVRTRFAPVVQRIDGLVNENNYDGSTTSQE